MLRVTNQVTFVILNEVKNLDPRVSCWGNAKAKGKRMR